MIKGGESIYLKILSFVNFMNAYSRTSSYIYKLRTCINSELIFCALKLLLTINKHVELKYKNRLITIIEDQEFTFRIEDS